MRNESGEIIYIQWSERATKTRQGDNPSAEAQVRPFCPKLMPNPEKPERCPIRLYSLYKTKKPAEKLTPESEFYLAINTNRPKIQSKWYKNSNMGKERIGLIVSKSAAKAGLSNLQWVSNHSIRKTMVTRLNRAKVPHVLIAQLSGHKNVASLGRYIIASMEEQKLMNAILQGMASSFHEPIPALPSAPSTTRPALPPAPSTTRPALSHAPSTASAPSSQIAIPQQAEPSHHHTRPALSSAPSQAALRANAPAPLAQQLTHTSTQQINTISQFELQGLFSGAQNISINNLNINLFKQWISCLSLW